MYIISPVQGLIDYSLQPPTLPTNQQQNSYTSENCVSGSLASGRSSSSKSKDSRQNTKTSGRDKKREQSKQPQQQYPPPAMEGMKSLAHPNLWPNIKQHIATSLAIIKNLTDFAQELSQMYEHHAEELQLLVGNYRKKNTELRKERGVSSCMLHVWESLLQEVEADSQAHSEIASVLGRQVSRHTLERTFHRKLQARKLLAHRESLDVVITKAEETLSKSRQEYRAAYANHLQSPQSPASLSAYLDAHNSYVAQLHATNAMVETYSKETLPDLLQELEDVYADLCNTMSDSVAQGAEIISNRTGAQSRRYCSVWSECKDMDATADTASLIRSLVIPPQSHPTHRLRLFTPPQHETDPPEVQVAQLKNELVTDRLASIQVPERYDSLCEEANSLHQEIQHLQDALGTMLRIQQRSLESSLFNKANELQEDISVKRYELKSAQLNLAAIQAQKELFAVKVDANEGGSSSDRKMSSASTASMKSKWLKAFKSLKTSPTNGSGSKDVEKDKRNGKDMGMVPSDSAHQFQEYTYKKITPCDVCSQVLRGHTRQGLKCRLCKLNVHIDCQERVGKCQTKSRLLRRQKSSSEIETTAAATRMNPGSSTAPVQHNEEQAGEILCSGSPRPGRSASPGSNSMMAALTTNDKSRSVTFRTPQEPTNNNHHHHHHHHHHHLDYGQGNPTRRRRLFGGMRSFSVFGQKSHDRAASLPETEQLQYAAGTRPFGQPLVLSGGASSTGSPPETPAPPKRRD